MYRKPGIVLDRDVYVAKMPLQRIACVNRIGPRRTEHQINHPDGFMHGMRGREAGLSDFMRGMIFDGKTLTLVNKGANTYAQVDAPGTLDHLIDELRDKFHKPFPGADLRWRMSITS